MAERLVPAVWLPAQPLDRIGEEPVPGVPPGLAKAVGLTALQVPWAISTALSGAYAYPMLTVIQPSEHHGRSFVVDPASLSEETRHVVPSADPRIKWHDEFGNPYTAWTYKGSYGQTIDVHFVDTDPGGVRYRGLQSSAALGRCLRASRVMREAGIETELITNAYLPELIPYGNRIMTYADVRRALFMRTVLERLGPVGETQDLDSSFRITEEVITEADVETLRRSLVDYPFVVTARSMLVPDRIADIGRGTDKQTVITKLTRAMDVLGIPKVGEYYQPVEYESFLTEVLPARMARNLRRMHDLGLTHKMTHLGNFTLTGGVIDLDSVLGPAIGLSEQDATVSVADSSHDIRYALYDDSFAGNMVAVLARMNRFGLIADAEEASLTFIRNLYDSYYSVLPSEGSIAITEETFLGIVARTIFEETRQRSNGRVHTRFDDMATTAAIEVLDSMRNRSRATGFGQSEERLDVTEWHSFIQKYLNQTAQSVRFFETFAGVDHAMLERALFEGVFGRSEQPQKQGGNDLLTAIMESVTAAYAEQFVPSGVLPDGLGSFETIGGIDTLVCPDTSIDEAVDYLLQLPINDIHVIHRSPVSELTRSRLDVPEDREGSTIFISSMASDVLRKGIFDDRTLAINQVARQARSRSESGRHDSVVRNITKVYEVTEIGLPALTRRSADMAFRPTGDHYLIYVNGGTAYLEMAFDDETTNSHLARLCRGGINVTLSYETPDNVSPEDAMHRFLAG